MSRPTTLILNEHGPWYAEKLAEQVPGMTFVGARTEDEALPHAPSAEVLIGLAPFIPSRLVSAMPRLRWVQALTTGIENLLRMKELPEGTPISRCGGFHGPQMSELALLLMMSLVRRFPQVIANQREAKWELWPQPLLKDKTMCVVGLGAIAEALAGYAAAFGMQVTGVSGGRAMVPGFAKVYPRSALADAAAEADFLVVLVPLTDETRNIVDAQVLAAMKPSAFLINIARGGCVDEEALLAALTSGQIAGAGLDVFATEPLPADNPFWSHPNVIVTPHCGGYADVYREQALPILVQNLSAYMMGGPTALADAAIR